MYKIVFVCIYIYPSILLFEYISKENVWFDFPKIQWFSSGQGFKKCSVFGFAWNELFKMRVNPFYFKSKVTIFQKY